VDIFEALRWLDGHLDHESGTVGIAAGRIEGLSLAPMAELVAVLGDPQDAVPTVHVTGTNGKGSVAEMITALVRASGLSVGTYTSPHESRLNERIRRDGEPIDDRQLAEVLSGVAAVEPLLAHTPTWFELVTAAAFRWFAELPVDLAVVEVGLLGRYDATNVVTADVAVVTTVGGDHTDFAPGWEVAVATEKAGIVTPGRPVVLGDVPVSLHEVFVAEGGLPVVRFGEEFGVAASRPAVGGRVVDLWGTRGGHDEVVLRVHGEHQAVNAAVAVATVEELFDRLLDDEVVAAAFESVALPGRLEVVAHQPLVVLDGAHNPDALAAMAGALDEEFSVVGSRRLVLGVLAGRDPAATVAAIGPARPDLVVCTAPDGDRSLPPDLLAREVDRAGWAAEVVADPTDAVQGVLAASAEEDVVVVCGSFRILRAAREAVARRMGSD